MDENHQQVKNEKTRWRMSSEADDKNDHLIHRYIHYGIFFEHIQAQDY